MWRTKGAETDHDPDLGEARSVPGFLEKGDTKEAHEGMPIEIEVTNVEETREALDGGADVILLDNMPPSEMRAVVELVGGRALTEASGGVTLENVRAVAETGVDRISVGALTHSSPALDISLEIEARG